MEQEILSEIELLRKQMVRAGSVHGLEHPKVLEYSIELDHLHNTLISLQNGNSHESKNRGFHLKELVAGYAL